ncbi:MAG: UDP-glucose 4-epimerase GalE [Neisseriaceae bacterium]|nr:UDP-glucose 4-epimerase GalE [Neisseriaceae bacterium]
MAILLTGGNGYIGSHTIIELQKNNHEIVVLDNLSNSSKLVLSRVEKITGQSIIFYQGDIRDRSVLRTIFSQHKITAVIHFAGLKSVSESVQNPAKYYDNNVTGSLVLIQEMATAEVFTLIFSSSATVYGIPKTVPINESEVVGNTTNPYGTSKLMVEKILHDIVKTDPRWSVTLLRYFNPAGAHESGLIGEDPNGIPNNLLPYITQVAVGKLDELLVFGHDYPTPDGTGVRDYIHVCDLANGHLKALETHQHESGIFTYNLGTGKGYSVLEVINAFKEATGINIPYKITAKRDGDVASCFADVGKAQKKLNWQCSRDLLLMMQDSWRWQCNNPNGYKTSAITSE